MTMKTKKTLQHIATVAVVLLALLVFATPVSAEITWTTENGVNTTTVSNVEGLKAALAYIETDTNAVADYVIKLSKDTYNVGILQINQTSERNVSLIGIGDEKSVLKGAIQINGKRNHDGTETLKFENLKFDGSELTKDDSTGVIYFMNGPSGYAHNVFLTNCEIVGSEKQINGIEIPGSNGYVYGLTLDTVKISHCNIAVQGYAHNDLSIVNCEFTLCSSGVNIQGGGLQSLGITDSTISVDKYALRAGTQGNDFGSLTLSGNTLTSENVDNGATIIFRGKFNEDDEVSVADNIITGANGLLMQDAATSASYTLDSSFFDLNNNYWGGAEPTEEQLGGISFAAGTSYYTTLKDDGTIDTDSSATAIGDFVAEVGGVYYDTLQYALKNLTADNNTLTLLRNVTISEDWDNRYTGARTTTVPVIIEGNGHNLTFTGAVSDGGNYHSVFRFQKDATVKNLTVDLSQAAGYGERQRVISTSANLTVDNCTFIGNSSLPNTRGISFGEGAGAAIGTLQLTVTNSEFKNWKRGVNDNENQQDAKSMTLTGNTFENAGVALSAHETVTFTGNTMKNGEVNIKSYSTSTECSVTATGNTLDEGKNNVISSVKSCVADAGFTTSGLSIQSGGAYYASLQDAVDAVNAGATITLMADVTVDTGVLIGKSLTITSETGQKYSITNDDARTGDVGATLVVNADDVTLKLDNVIINAENYAVRIWNVSEIQITNSEINGWTALYFKEGSDGTKATISKSTLVGTNDKTGDSNDFGTIVFEDSNVTVAVTDSVVKAIANTETNQSIVVFSNHFGPNNYDKVTFTGGELVLDKGNSASVFVSTADNAQNDAVIIGANVYTNFNPSAYIAGGMEVVQPGDKYLVQKYVDRSYSGSSVKPEEPEQPEQPEEPVDPETPLEPETPEQPETPETPETPEQPEGPSSPAPILGVLAALGAAAVIRRK